MCDKCFLVLAESHTALPAVEGGQPVFSASQPPSRATMRPSLEQVKICTSSPICVLGTVNSLDQESSALSFDALRTTPPPKMPKPTGPGEMLGGYYTGGDVPVSNAPSRRFE